MTDSSEAWISSLGETGDFGRMFVLDALMRPLSGRARRLKGIRIQNWHCPLGTHMTLLLGNGLELRHLAEPSATVALR